MITRDYIRDNTDMYLGTVQISAKELIELLDNYEKKDLLHWLKQQDISILVQIQSEISRLVQDKLKEITAQVPEVRVKQKEKDASNQ